GLARPPGDLAHHWVQQRCPARRERCGARKRGLHGRGARTDRRVRRRRRYRPLARAGDELSALRVALVGYGMGGSLFHAPFIAADPRLALAMVVTADPDRRI